MELRTKGIVALVGGGVLVIQTAWAVVTVPADTAFFATLLALTVGQVGAVVSVIWADRNWTNHPLVRAFRAPMRIWCVALAILVVWGEYLLYRHHGFDGWEPALEGFMPGVTAGSLAFTAFVVLVQSLTFVVLAPRKPGRQQGLGAVTEDIAATK